WIFSATRGATIWSCMPRSVPWIPMTLPTSSIRPVNIILCRRLFLEQLTSTASNRNHRGLFPKKQDGDQDENWRQHRYREFESILEKARRLYFRVLGDCRDEQVRPVADIAERTKTGRTQ